MTEERGAVDDSSVFAKENEEKNVAELSPGAEEDDFMYEPLYFFLFTDGHRSGDHRRL